jgi:hypothetical protein
MNSEDACLSNLVNKYTRCKFEAGFLKQSCRYNPRLIAEHGWTDLLEYVSTKIKLKCWFVYLFLAINRNNIKLVRYILTKLVYGSDEYIEAILASIRNKNIEMISTLLRYRKKLEYFRISISDLDSCMAQAAMIGSIGLVKYFRSKDASDLDYALYSGRRYPGVRKYLLLIGATDKNYDSD